MRAIIGCAHPREKSAPDFEDQAYIAYSFDKRILAKFGSLWLQTTSVTFVVTLGRR